MAGRGAPSRMHTSAVASGRTMRALVQDRYRTSDVPSEHADPEFQGCGMLTCEREIVANVWFSVAVRQSTSVNDAEDEGVLELLEPIIREYSSRDMGECTPDEVEEQAQALLGAVAFIRTEARA